MTPSEVRKWIQERESVRRKPGFRRIQRFLDALHHPEKGLSVIHVTGTNGKGSTIATLQSLFIEHHKKVGSFVSPHMIDYRDRILLNGQPVTWEQFALCGEQVFLLEKEWMPEEGMLSFFEILTLIMLLVFKKERVEVALIEVGIGGLNDVTNVIPSEISVITTVGYDHQKLLGNSIEEIAMQKAGIFKEKNDVVVGYLPEEAFFVVDRVAKAYHCSLYSMHRDFTMMRRKNGFEFRNHEVVWDQLQLNLIGSYQEDNTSLALQVFYRYMRNHQNLIQIESVRVALSKVIWQGRMEKMQDNPFIYLDGAHNLPAIECLCREIQEKKQTSTLLFAGLKRKDLVGMLEYIHQELPELSVYLTTFDDREAAGEEDYVTVQEKMGYPFQRDYMTFIEQWIERATEEEILYITGSLHFISEVRHDLTGREVQSK